MFSEDGAALDFFHHCRSTKKGKKLITEWAFDKPCDIGGDHSIMCLD